MNKTKPKIVVIAGPNGAGKTTFAEEFLPQEADCPDFINADLIAYGLSPFVPEKSARHAGEIVLRQINTYVNQRKSFAFETTLSGLVYAKKIAVWKKTGFYIKLVFLSLPSVEFALARVRMRVAQGGHNIPEDIVRRRFERSRKNFERVYKFLADDWIVYDNSNTVPRVLESKCP